MPQGTSERYLFFSQCGCLLIAPICAGPRSTAIRKGPLLHGGVRFADQFVRRQQLLCGAYSRCQDFFARDRSQCERPKNKSLASSPRDRKGVFSRVLVKAGLPLTPRCSTLLMFTNCASLFMCFAEVFIKQAPTRNIPPSADARKTLHRLNTYFFFTHKTHAHTTCLPSHNSTICQVSFSLWSSWVFALSLRSSFVFLKKGVSVPCTSSQTTLAADSTPNFAPEPSDDR